MQIHLHSLHLIEILQYLCRRIRQLYNNVCSLLLIELSHVIQVRAEGPKAPSPGHRPGYDGNQQDAL